MTCQVRPWKKIKCFIFSTIKGTFFLHFEHFHFALEPTNRNSIFFYWNRKNNSIAASPLAISSLRKSCARILMLSLLKMHFNELCEQYGWRVSDDIEHNIPNSLVFGFLQHFKEIQTLWHHQLHIIVSQGFNSPTQVNHSIMIKPTCWILDMGHSLIKLHLIKLIFHPPLDYSFFTHFYVPRFLVIQISHSFPVSADSSSMKSMALLRSMCF